MPTKKVTKQQKAARRLAANMAIYELDGVGEAIDPGDWFDHARLASDGAQIDTTGLTKEMILTHPSVKKQLERWANNIIGALQQYEEPDDALAKAMRR